jgi:hypothetical protein
MSGAAQPCESGGPVSPAAAKRPLTGRPHKPCSHPPKPCPRAYDRRPGAGPGRTHRTQCHGTDRRPVHVVVPDEPPTLTPAAARTLLRILLNARPRAEGNETDERRERS